MRDRTGRSHSALGMYQVQPPREREAEHMPSSGKLGGRPVWGSSSLIPEESSNHQLPTRVSVCGGCALLSIKLPTIPSSAPRGPEAGEGQRRLSATGFGNTQFWEFPLLSYCMCCVFLAVCYLGCTHSPGQLCCPRGLALVQRPVPGARPLHQPLQELQRLAELLQLGSHPTGPEDGQTGWESLTTCDRARQCIPILSLGKINSFV